MGSKSQFQKLEKLEEILVPIDFSEESIKAFLHACLFAKEFSANITVFHSIGTYGQEISDYTTNYFLTLKDPKMPSLAELAQREMDTFLKKHAPKGLNIKKVIQEIGPIAKQILECSEKIAADLIIVGTHGKKGLDRLVLGSVAEKVLRQSTRPVLTVRQKQMPISTQMEKVYKKILIGTDFSEHSEFAISQGLTLAKRLNAQVDLVHVVDERIFLPLKTIAVRSVLEEYENEIKKEAQKNLEKYVGDHSNSKDFFGLEILFGTPAKEMEKAANRLQSDLIILGSHGHAKFSNLFLGSTAERIAQRSPCPLLLIK